MAHNSISSGGILRMITHSLAAIAMLGFTAVVASAGEVALAWSRDAASNCRFVAPRSLTAGPTLWTGACPGGKASGLGMLRRRDAGAAGVAFYGEMRDGVPVIGVINVDGAMSSANSRRVIWSKVTTSRRCGSIHSMWRPRPHAK